MFVFKFYKPSDKTKLTGYPNYPADEDIYNKNVETDIDPEKLAEKPLKSETGAEDELKKISTRHLTDLNDDSSKGLDVPGTEQDDLKKKTDNEDEENNYYSPGSDNNDEMIKEE